MLPNLAREVTLMADPSRPAGIGVGPDRAPAPATPLWVKLCGAFVLALLVLVVVMLVAGGGSHGPGRHMPDKGAGGHVFPSDLIDGVVRLS